MNRTRSKTQTLAPKTDSIASSNTEPGSNAFKGLHIEEIRLRNFRLFSDLKLELAPITLLTGANSSGKSSVLSAVGAVLQTSGTPPYPLSIALNGPNCRLGGFRDVVKDGNSRASFQIGLQVRRRRAKQELSASFRYAPNGEHILPQEFEFNSNDEHLNVTWKGTEVGYVRTTKTAAHIQGPNQSAFVKISEFVSKLLAEQTKEGWRPIDYEKHLTAARNEVGKAVPLGRRTADLQEQLVRHSLTSPAWSAISSLIQELQANLAFVGPVRAYPSRHYAIEQSVSNLDPEGRNAVDRLYHLKKNNRRQFNEVASLLESIGLAGSIRTSISRESILSLDISPTSQRAARNYADVGFGVSQILPVFIKDVMLGTSGTMLINQPEVHLHPSSQAQLANYMAGRVAKRRYIVETHSEYLINRFRLLIAQGALPATDVAVYYFDQNEDGASEISRISLSSDGSLIGAPARFFQTYSNDTFNLAMALVSCDDEEDLPLVRGGQDDE